jgi:hypothetical protein
MLTVSLFALAALFAWLAIDAWRVRGGDRLPFQELLKLRGQSARRLPLVEQEARQKFDENWMTGNTKDTYLVFVVLSLGCLAGGAFRLL